MAYTKGNPRHAKSAASEPEKVEQPVEGGAEAPSAPEALPIRQFKPFAPSMDILNEPPVSDGMGSSDHPTPRKRTVSGNPRRRSVQKQAAAAVSASEQEAPEETTAERFSAASRRESAAISEMKKHRKRRRVLVGVLSCLVAMLLVAGGVAFAYISNIDKNLRAGVGDDLLAMLTATDTPEDPFYALLLGIDGSIERESTMGSNFRSDSMMLARIDPKNHQVTLVSIPRDIKLDDLDGHGTQKINAAHAYGGPALAVKTVSEVLGVPISHYAEINFDGFRAAVDALGGVEVDVPIEINDSQAGGHLDAGVQTLDGSQALILCRSRHSYDDYGAGDDYRAANQRTVISAIAQKVLASDPLTMSNTISAMSEYVTTDMSVAEIVAIAQSMSGMTADNIYSAKLPATAEYADGVWWDILDVDGVKEMMLRVDAGLPPAEEEVIDPKTGTILSTAGDGAYQTSLTQVHAANRGSSIGLRNGNGSDGVCTKAEEVLRAMGYTKINARNADNFDYGNTVIVYKSRNNKQDAELIAQQLGVGDPIPDRDVYLFDEDILIVLGADYS